MAQGIEVPQTTPNAPQFQVPTDLVNAYLARKQNEQKMFLDTTENLGNAVNTMRQQKIQNQLAALEAYSKIAGTSGITAANQMAPNIPGGMNTQNLPTDPFSQPLPSPIEPQQGDQSIPPQGTPQNATLPISQDQSPSQAIALSSQVGHPDVAGHYAFHASDPNAIPPLPTLSPQMAANNAEILRASHVGGSYAANRVKSLSEANAGLAAQDTAMQAPVKFAQEQKNFQQTQTREANQFATAQTNEKNRTVTSEVAKLSPQVQEANMLEGMYNDLSANLKESAKVKSLPGSGNAYNASLGRVGNKNAGMSVNEAKNIIPAINKILTGRFTMGENQVLNANMAPSPSATPEYNAQRLAIIKQVIDAIKTGNALNVQNVVNSVNGKAVSFGSPMGSTITPQNDSGGWKYIGPVKK